VGGTDGPGGGNEWLLGRGGVGVHGDDLASRIAAAITAQGQGARPWRLLVTDGAQLPTVASLAGPRATITVLATEGIPALPGEALAREVTIVGVAGPHPDLIVEAAAMCVKGEIDLAGGAVFAPAGARTRVTIAT